MITVPKSKNERLVRGGNALSDLGCVGGTSYEGGDGGEDTEWHNDYRVWPTEECDKHDVADACADHPGDGYILSASMTDPKHDFIYVTVRTV